MPTNSERLKFSRLRLRNWKNFSAPDVAFLRGKYRHWRPEGTWQTEEQFSDGTLQLIGLLWAAMDRGKGPLSLPNERTAYAGLPR